MWWFVFEFVWCFNCLHAVINDGGVNAGKGDNETAKKISDEPFVPIITDCGGDGVAGPGGDDIRWFTVDEGLFFLLLWY